MKLLLDLDNTIEFCEKTAGGPHPYLLSVGQLLTSAIPGAVSGIAATESANLSVTIDNRGKRAAGILGRPLRVPARVLDDNDALFFEGAVSSIEYGRVITLGIDA